MSSAHSTSALSFKTAPTSSRSGSRSRSRSRSPSPSSGGNSGNESPGRRKRSPTTSSDRTAFLVPPDAPALPPLVVHQSPQQLTVDTSVAIPVPVPMPMPMPMPAATAASSSQRSRSSRSGRQQQQQQQHTFMLDTASEDALSTSTGDDAAAGQLTATSEDDPMPMTTSVNPISAGGGSGSGMTSLVSPYQDAIRNQHHSRNSSLVSFTPSPSSTPEHSPRHAPHSRRRGSASRPHHSAGGSNGGSVGHRRSHHHHGHGHVSHHRRQRTVRGSPGGSGSDVRRAPRPPPRPPRSIRSSSAYASSHRASSSSSSSDSDSDSENHISDSDLHSEAGTARTFESNSSYAAGGAPRTVKERQAAINQEHPFGFRLWKPALYKKKRGIDLTAEQELFSGLSPRMAPTSSAAAAAAAAQGGIPGSPTFTSLRSRRSRMTAAAAAAAATPGGFGGEATYISGDATMIAGILPSRRAAFSKVAAMLNPWNLVWTLACGLPLAVSTLLASFFILVVSLGFAYPTSLALARLAGYWAWPWGRDLVKVHRIPASALSPTKWLTRLTLLGLAAPVYFVCAAACWMCVVYIPMAKATKRVWSGMWADPLALVVDGVVAADASAHVAMVPVDRLADPGGAVPDWVPGNDEEAGRPLIDGFSSDEDEQGNSARQHQPAMVRGQVVLCIARAGGLRYLKYTWHGTNVMFVNLIPFVLWVVAEGYVLSAAKGGDDHDDASGQALRLFSLCLLATIPLSYFIGMAVASISAQSSPAIGAVLNATFGSIIEITLYSLALHNGKHELVEGAVTGTLLGVLLLLPGVSMIAGGLKHKQMRFNAKSAGVSNTMLIMTLIGGFTPTLFNHIFGSFDMRCARCTESSCSDCTNVPRPPGSDYVYLNAVVPLSRICAVILPLIYAIGLIFSLKTHKKHIYHSPTPVSAPPSAPVSHSVPTSTGTVHRVPSTPPNQHHNHHRAHAQHSHPVLTPASFMPPASYASLATPGSPTMTLSLPAPAMSHLTSNASNSRSHPLVIAPPTPIPVVDDDEHVHDGQGGGGGHEAPEWSRGTSMFVLISCTITFALIAELLVDTIEAVLHSVPWIPEKFLGVTLVALVPSLTEFVNAAAFALQGNISLSLEIGSAYAVQVALIQIPALVWYSVISEYLGIVPKGGLGGGSRMLALIFPSWDFVCVFLSVFLLSYVYMEGNSNYFKGAILTAAYTVLIAAFYFASTLPVHAPLSQSFVKFSAYSPTSPSAAFHRLDEL